jgi:phenylalanyl-tRNA synthetase beta chain
MKFSENWLRERVAVPVDRAALAHRLTMAGHEVEQLTPLGDGLDVVVEAQN